MVVQTRESVSSFQSEDGDATRQFSLDDKYIKKEGVILCSGIQALVRLPIDQHLADKQQGLNTATLVSGYRGSPLGGIDLEFQHRKKMLDAHQVTFISGVNEELAATAIFGSQTANLLPDPKYDGVLGMWYGKGPGLDRSGDVLRHANYAGVGRYGGVLAISGDDPNAKSSTIPSHTESTFFDLMLPVLYPGNVQEVLDMGRYGFELSRYSGLWVGFKIVTNVADEFSTAEVFPERINIEYPQFMHKGKAWQHTQSPYLLTPQSLLLEKELVEGRLEAALHFARLNKLNSIVLPTKNAWLGIVAAGKTYYDLRQALHDVGLDDDELRRHGIRLLKIGMLYPMEPEIIFRFAENLEKILVIEEKRSFIEMFVRDILYQKTERPNVLGKRDQKGDKLIKAYGELGADDIVEVLVRIIGEYIPPESMNEKFNARMEAIRTPANIDIIPLMSRSPFYCSGCPHNRSTDTPEGLLVGAGIGCHSLMLLMPNRKVTGLTAMGGEGAQWVGATPFTNSF